MLADRGTAAGSPNPPASCAGVSPRGSSNRASGLPARLGNDPIQHVLIQPSRQDRLQQRPRITMPSGSTRSSGKPASALAPFSRREDERDLLRQEAARHERERARRRTIEPLRVIDDTQERLLLRGLGQQAEGRQSDQERTRGLSRHSVRRRHRAHRAGDPADGPIGRGSASTAAEAPRKGAPSPPRPRRSAATRNCRPAWTVQSSSAVFPTPGSPCTTKTPPSPPRAARSRRPSTSRSRCRPSNWAPGGLVSVRTCDGEPIYGGQHDSRRCLGHELVR